MLIMNDKEEKAVNEYLKKVAPLLKIIGMDSAMFKVMLERAEKELKEKKENEQRRNKGQKKKAA